MKKITLFALATGSMLHVSSQVVLSEDFNSPFQLSATGWTVQNNSTPVGSIGWFQGNPTAFSAYNGGASDYYAANFNSAATAGGDISNWLISPAVTIYDGAVVEFATRKTATSPVFADRLQLRMSQTGVYNIPPGATSVGSFTDLLLDINPNLTTNNTNVVSNGTVNGYPQSWSVFTVMVTGVTGTVTGRFAFRYFVTNGGSGGTNSEYIGVDAFRYTLPCGPTVQSYTVCQNTSTTLQAIGVASTTYSWNTSATTSSIVVNPGSTTVYSLFPSVGGSVSCGNVVEATVTVGSALSVSATASQYTVCAGRTVTLTADGPANSFLWGTTTSTISATQVVTVAPQSTTTYTVGALNGFCLGTNSLIVTALPNPTLSYVSSPSVACPNSSFTLTANGAQLYTWILGTQATTLNPVSINTGTNTAGGTFSMILVGTGSNGCSVAGIINNTIAPTPTVVASISKTLECINRVVTMSVTGADTYTWSGSGTSNSPTFTYNTGGSAGVKTFTVVGTNSAGCVSSTANIASVSVSVSACAGVTQIDPSQMAEVYPNPFSQELRIDDFTGSIVIYNNLGQAIMEKPVNGGLTIDTSSLPKGVYILKAVNKNGDIIRNSRVVKN